MPPINFETMHATADLLVRDSEGMYVSRLELMSQMLGEMAAGTWKPTGLGAREKNLEGVVIGLSLDSWEADRRAYLTMVKRNLQVARSTDDRSYYQNRIDETTKKSPCGFTACAVGHAMLDARFEDAGLCHSGTDYPVHWVEVDGQEDKEEYNSWYAVTTFFGIPLTLANWMFSPEHYTPETVDSALAVKERVDYLIKHGRNTTLHRVNQFERGTWQQ